MSFRFLQPHSLQEAQELILQYGNDAKLIAGGMAVVLMIQQKLIAPKILISLSRVPELDHQQETSDGLHLGPTQLLRTIERSRKIREDYPALANACGVVGNVRVRNQATLGGNLAEADYASDPPTMLLALKSAVTISGPAGSRVVPLSDFFLGFYTTVLEADELITDIFVPRPLPGTRMAYIKYRSRSSEDRPCVGVAAVADFDGEICRELKVAVGAACEVPRRLPEVEALSKGERLTDALVGEIAEGYAAGIETLEDLRGSAWYRTQMIRVFVKQALEEVRDGRR
ncbi:MAG: xanthine dehydrogenase family protein subunit M [Anaerolineales bacterium]|jgi:carbon-monoxide dehydrogenase medium subunit